MSDTKALFRPAGFDFNTYTPKHFKMEVAGKVMTITLNRPDKLNAYTAKTLRKVRLKCEGALIGSSTALNTIQLDFIGKIVGHTGVDVDGLYYATIELDGLYDSSQTASWKVTTISTVSAAYTSV